MSEIYEEKGTVTLVDGVGMFRYKIRKPTPSVSRKIGCAVTDPVNKSINMFVNPGDVAPPVTPETFKVSTKMEGEYIVYDVVSNLLYSDTSAPFNVKETSVDVKPIETFTISSVKSGNGVVFTVKSSDLVSKTVVNVTMTEYRPGTPITVIKTNVANVTLNNGVGTVTHAINQTQPPVDQKVEGKITNTPSVRTEVTVPKYVAPAPPWNPSVSLDWGISKATTASGSTNITITYNNPDGRPEARLFNMWSFLYHSIQGDTMGECTLSPDVFTLSPGQSKVVTLTWTRNSIRLDRKVGTIHPFIQSKLTGSVAGNQYNWMDIKPFSALDVSY